MMMRFSSTRNGVQEIFHPMRQLSSSTVKSSKCSGIHYRYEDAEAPGICCRLCGGVRGVHKLGDTCIWEGVEERYDQLISESFDVKVTPNSGMICDRCIMQLRSTQKFKALVHAAFAKASNPSSVKTAIEVDSHHTVLDKELPAPIREIIKNSSSQSDANEKILQLLNKRPDNDRMKKKSKTTKKNTYSFLDRPPLCKRTIVMCNACGHRYPMLVQGDTITHLFICSRCKLKKSRERMVYCRKCNITLPTSSMKEHISALHSKNECAKARCPQHKPSFFKDPVRSSHTEAEEYVCGICSKDLRTRNLLEQHMSLHSAEMLYKCDLCKRVFKGKKELRLHYLSHENFNTKITK